MIHAYDKNYLEKARIMLGRMLDYAVYDLNIPAKEMMNLFIASPYSKKFESGDTSLLSGKSGVELACEIVGRFDVSQRPVSDRSPEYWAGWALAYYQWYTRLPFSRIIEFADTDTVINMYLKYHETDISKFVDRLNELYKEHFTDCNLKRIRLQSGLSQSELSELSGVPVRTIQQYEQRQKNINAAKAETVIALSIALSCRAEELLETL